MKKLTVREAAFVDAYTGKAEGNGGKAAMLAGYSKAGAYVRATRLLKKGNVVEAIAKKREQIEAAITEQAKKIDRAFAEQAKKYDRALAEQGAILDVVGRLARLSVIASKGEPRDSVKAIDVMNKMDGLYITKVGDPKGQPLIPPGSAFAFVVTQIPGAENRT